MRRIEIIPGEKHNNLKIIEEVMPILSCGRFRRRVFCECECGNTGIYLLYVVRNGNTKSCGCLRDTKTIERNIAGTGSKRKQYIKQDNNWWNRGNKK